MNRHKLLRKSLLLILALTAVVCLVTFPRFLERPLKWVEAKCLIFTLGLANEEVSNWALEKLVANGEYTISLLRAELNADLPPDPRSARYEVARSRRWLVAEALLKLNDKSVIPYLLTCLREGDGYTKCCANLQLGKLTKQYFGPLGGGLVNKQEEARVIRQWEQWWEENKENPGR